MVSRNIVVFSAATTDRRIVLKLAGALDANDPSPSRIFETRKHSVTISKQQYVLYDTAGFPDSEELSLGAREVFGNLYRFICMLDGGINLLIYIVHDQPSPNNLKLFHDYLCRRDSPIILVRTNPSHPLSIPDGFNHLTVLPLDSAVPDKDRTKLLQNTITNQVKKSVKMMQPLDRFESTARESWKLLEQVARWSLADCRDALKATFMEDACLSEKDSNARRVNIAEHIRKHYSCNVIVFGDTGAGKTSVIKMLTDKCEIDSKASSAGGSTFKSQDYKIDIEEYHYVFHDTVGLDDATSTSMSPEDAIKSLYQLITKLDGGISMLVYVHRGKIKPSQINNYKLFSHVICDKKVPTVLVVTGLEQEDSRDAWWDANKYLFDAQKIDTKYHVCITSTKGKFSQRHQEFIYQDEYEESRKMLKDVFLRAPLLNPWKVKTTPNVWKSLVVEVYNIFAAKFKWRPLAANKPLYQKLMDIAEMQEDAAMNLANNMERVLPRKPTLPRSPTLLLK